MSSSNNNLLLLLLLLLLYYYYVVVLCDQKGAYLAPISQHLHLLASKRRQIETTISPTNQQLVFVDAAHEKVNRWINIYDGLEQACW